MLRGTSVNSPCASFLNPRLRNYFSSAKLSPIRTSLSRSPARILEFESNLPTAEHFNESMEQRRLVLNDPHTEVLKPFRTKAPRQIRSVRRTYKQEQQPVYSSSLYSSHTSSLKTLRPTSTDQVNALRFRSGRSVVYLALPKSRVMPRKQRQIPTCSMKLMRLECNAERPRKVTVETLQSMIEHNINSRFR